MPLYIVRVELRKAAAEDYERLHQALGGVGFSRTLSVPDGQQFLLPPAHYCIKIEYELDSVLDTVKTAVSKTGKEAGILITESHQTAWSGLEIAKTSGKSA